MQVHKHALKSLCFDRQAILVLCCSFGLSFGIYFGFKVGDTLSSFLLRAGYAEQKFPFIAPVIPVTLIWLSAWRGSPGLIYPIMFIKAVTDGVITVALTRAFHSAAWLFAPMLLVSDRLATVISLLFAAQCLEDDNLRIHRRFALYLTLTVTASLLDYIYISPYLASLML